MTSPATANPAAEIASASPPMNPAFQSITLLGRDVSLAYRSNQTIKGFAIKMKGELQHSRHRESYAVGPVRITWPDASTRLNGSNITCPIEDINFLRSSSGEDVPTSSLFDQNGRLRTEDRLTLWGPSYTARMRDAAFEACSEHVPAEIHNALSADSVMEIDLERIDDGEQRELWNSSDPEGLPIQIISVPVMTTWWLGTSANSSGQGRSNHMLEGRNETSGGVHEGDESMRNNA